MPDCSIKKLSLTWQLVVMYVDILWLELVHAPVHRQLRVKPSGVEDGHHYESCARAGAEALVEKGGVLHRGPI